MTLTDDFVQQFADAKNKGSASVEDESVEGVLDAASEGSADAAVKVEGAGPDDQYAGGGSETGAGEATGGDPEGSGDASTPTESEAGGPADESGAGDDGGETGPPADPVAAADYWRKYAEREEKRRRDSQAFHDKQMQEIKAKNEALEQLWDTEDAEYEAQQAAAAQAAAFPVDEQLDAWVQVAPVDAFNAVLAQAPGRVQEVIARIGQVHGPEMASLAREAHLTMVSEQRAASLKDEVSQLRESIEAPAKKRAEMAASLNSARQSLTEAGYTTQELELLAPKVRDAIPLWDKAEVKAYYGGSAAAFIEAQYLRAYKDQSVVAASQQYERAAPAPHVETGGGARVEEPAPSYAEVKAKQLAAAFTNGRTYD